jgi:hypothetical protein
MHFLVTFLSNAGPFHSPPFTLNFSPFLNLSKNPARIKVTKEAVVDNRVVCAQCNLEERDCKCDRYCTYCKGQEGIRLCVDGLYYCPDCRQACEISVVSDAAN